MKTNNKKTCLITITCGPDTKGPALLFFSMTKGRPRLTFSADQGVTVDMQGPVHEVVMTRCETTREKLKAAKGKLKLL